MGEQKDLLILAVVGMPATGKSEVLKLLKEKYNFFHLYYGGITLEETQRRGLELTEENERMVREDMRKSGDMGIYSRFMLPKIEKAISEGHTKIILESMYNIWEYEIIKDKYPDNFKVLAIHSDFDIRLQRIGTRADRKLNLEELNSRQISEAKNLGKGTVIALADYHYVNNGSDMKVFEQDMLVFFQNNLKLLTDKNEYIKNYNKWNQDKKIANNQNKILEFPKKREVWMVKMGLNIGYEQNGDGENFSRPILIVKKFNNHMFWGIPLSTKQKDFDFYFNFTDINNQKVSAILAQMKLFSIKRFTRKLYDLDPQIFQEITMQVKKLF